MKARRSVRRRSGNAMDTWCLRRSTLRRSHAPPLKSRGFASSTMSGTSGALIIDTQLDAQETFFLPFANKISPIALLELPASLPNQIRHADITPRALPFIDGNGLQV